MASAKDRSNRLKAGLANYDKVADETDQTFSSIDDALTQLEDREARRSVRNRAADPRSA